MTAENVTGKAPERIDDMVADVRDLRDRIAGELASTLTDDEKREVAEVAASILGWTAEKRAALGVMLRETQRRPDVTLS